MTKATNTLTQVEETLGNCAFPQSSFDWKFGNNA